MVFGWTLAPLIEFVNKYVFDDWEYLKFLFVIVMVDTCLGFYKAIMKREVSSRGFAMVFNKVTIYSCTLIATSVLVRFTVEGAVQTAFGWFDSVVFSAIIVRETISIFENTAEIDPKLLPRQLLRYLKAFDKYTGRPIDHNQNNTK